MINQDLLDSARTLLKNLNDLRKESDLLNVSVMEAMGSSNPTEEMRALFPAIIKASGKASDLISAAFLSVNWEVEGNKPQILYDILGGVNTEIPEDLKSEVAEFMDGMSGTEAEMIRRFGDDPITSCIEKLGLEEELADLINQQDEVQALMTALGNTPDMPLAAEE